MTPTPLKRPDPETDEHEQIIKRRQVYHDKQENSNVLAEVESALSEIMSLLCWNFRGLRNPQTDQKLGDLIQAQDLLVVFMTETWLDKARLEEIRVRYKFGGLIEVVKESRGGGVAVFWKAEYDFLVDTYSLNHIGAIVNKGKKGE